jgi:hypothetical protein
VNVAKKFRHGYNDKIAKQYPKKKSKEEETIKVLRVFSSYKAGLMNFHTSQRINGKPE